MVAKVMHWGGEAAICIEYPVKTWTATRFKKSFFSEDSEHGWSVESLAWSPDGRFIAYQLGNSGGHQPYRSPVEVLDVKDGSVRDVEKCFRAECPGVRIEAVTYWQDLPCWSADGRLHFAVNHSGENRPVAHEYAFNPATGKIANVKTLEPSARTTGGK